MPLMTPEQHEEFDEFMKEFHLEECEQCSLTSEKPVIRSTNVSIIHRHKEKENDN